MPFLGNNEKQYYTENRRENARVENGKLIIEARKEKFKNRKTFITFMRKKLNYPVRFISLKLP